MVERKAHNMFRSIAALMFVSVAAVSLTGCGSAVSGSAAASEIDVRKLDTGAYPTDPLDYRAKYAHSNANGINLAVMRLADSVANGWEIDPTLKYARLAKPLTTATQVGELLADVDTAIVARENMMFGFAMSATTTAPVAKDYSVQRDVNSKPDQPQLDTIAVNLTVLQFPDADSARRAAADVEAADFAVAAGSNTAVALDTYPDAKAHWRQGIPTIGTTMARGSYLVNVFVKRPDADLDKLKELTRKVLATELPLLDGLAPLTKRDVLHLDYDPQAMMRRTLHPGDIPSPDYSNEYVLTPRGFLPRVVDTDAWRHLMDVGGVDLLSATPDGGLLMRARDAAAAADLGNEFKRVSKRPADPPADVPGAFCSENTATAPYTPGDRFYCTVRYGRYIARVSSAQRLDAQQRAAAQFALLANSSWM
ncbi:hypothetical protein [Nocardia sp. NPDC056100]|uniref:DUF7373 family lipoprotein n=1 Tax=Nocardia sp. NPDC056100 TaxID=3345712 RepID=UPI0035D82538